ncbi:MAG: CDP-alcohol phosphatidyltransferase family protein [Phycisphaerales bacterium]|nr:MAG: CDP-alcohol phosphatidyltransferase family protein [Phycisphaerales bacterium]
MPSLAKFPQGERPRRRRRRLKSLAFLPTLITLGSLLCGFSAVHFALRAMHDFGAGMPLHATPRLQASLLDRMLPSFLSVGAGLVILGMILDGFDGLIARATRSTTNFGGQLDSLADVVTCGVAPATLMIAFMTTELAQESIMPSPISEHFFGRLCWVAAAVYVSFTAIRLARYNVEHAEADFDYRMFRGLPTPGAGCIMVALIILQDQLGDAGRRMVMYALPAVAVLTAFLMVSRIPYRRFYRAYLLGRQPFGQFVLLMLILALFFSFKAPALVVIVSWYVVSGPFFLLSRRMRERFAPRPVEVPSENDSNDRKLA